MPYYENPDEIDENSDNEVEVLIMRLTKEGEDDILESIEDEAEYNKIADYYNNNTSSDFSRWRTIVWSYFRWSK